MAELKAKKTDMGQDAYQATARQAEKNFQKKAAATREKWAKIVDEKEMKRWGLLPSEPPAP